MAWHFQTDDQVTLANDSALILPNADWTISGWFRVQSTEGTNFHRLFSWGTTAGPYVTIFILDKDYEAVNADHLCARVSDGTNITDVLFLPSPALSTRLNRWLCLTLHHVNSTNYTYLRLYDPVESSYVTDGTSKALGVINPGSDAFFGSYPDGTHPLNGDLANWAMYTGINFYDPLRYGEIIRGVQAYRNPACKWHVPMLDDRYEEWVNQLGVTNFGATATGDAAPGALITPRQITLAPEYSANSFQPSGTSALEISGEATVTNDSSYHASDTLELSQACSVQQIADRSVSSPLALSSVAEYVGPRVVEAYSFLDLRSEARIPETYLIGAESQLSLTQLAYAGGTKRLWASSTLAIGSVADTIIKVRADITSQLVLTSSAYADKILRASSVLNLQQSVGLGAIWLSAHTVLTLTQSAHYPIYVSVEHSLTTTELVFDPITASVVEVATGLRDKAIAAPASGRNGGQTLSFAQLAGVVVVRASGTPLSASSVLTFTQDARLSLTGEASSVLVLTSTAIAHAARLAATGLVLSQAADATVTRGSAAGSTIGVRQAVAYTLIIGSSISQYSPFVGTNTDPTAPTPPPVSIDGPMAGIQVPFQLVYPSVGIVTDSLSLKAPNLGNKDRLSFNRISRETRGGTVIVFADPDWPKIQTQVVQFSGLLRVEAQALLTFVDTHLGQEIGMIDWEHRFWKGIITVPDEPVIEDRFDSFTASFQFEGELDPTWNPQVVPPSLRYSATRTPQQDGYYVPNTPQLPLVPSTDYFTHETDATLIIGNPVVIKTNGHLDLASASSAPQVVGITISAASATFAANYITDGSVTLSDWTLIIGATNLWAGQTYFLDTTVGRLTATPPSTPGQYVVRVGRAVSTTILDVEIELPILL